MIWFFIFENGYDNTASATLLISCRYNYKPHLEIISHTALSTLLQRVNVLIIDFIEKRGRRVGAESGINIMKWESIICLFMCGPKMKDEFEGKSLLQ